MGRAIREKIVAIILIKASGFKQRAPFIEIFHNLRPGILSKLHPISGAESNMLEIQSHISG